MSSHDDDDDDDDDDNKTKNKRWEIQIIRLFRKSFYDQFRQEQKHISTSDFFGKLREQNDEKVALLMLNGANNYSKKEKYYIYHGIVLGTFGFLKGSKHAIKYLYLYHYNKNSFLRKTSSSYELYNQSTTTGTTTTGTSTNSSLGRRVGSTAKKIIWVVLENLTFVYLSFLVPRNICHDGRLLPFKLGTYPQDGNFAKIPLKSGRSAISDHFCPIMIKQYNDLQQRISAAKKDRAPRHDHNARTTELVDKDQNKNENTWQLKGNWSTGTLEVTLKDDLQNTTKWDDDDVKTIDDILNNPHQPEIKGWIEFINNCEKRKAIEDRIRRQQQKELLPLDSHSDEPIDIPYPGVPVVVEEWNNDELSSWVSDQEEGEHHDDNNSTN